MVRRALLMLCFFAFHHGMAELGGAWQDLVTSSSFCAVLLCCALLTLAVLCTIHQVAELGPLALRRAAFEELGGLDETLSDLHDRW